MNSIRSSFHRHRRLLLWCAGILIIYSGLGFLFVPWLAERQLVSTLDERLDIEASVERIRFNPFTFAAEIEQLQLDQADSPTLLSLPRLYVNFQPSRLFIGRVRFEEIAINELALYVERHSATENTLTRLGDRWAATAPPDEDPAPEEDEGGMITLEAGLFSFTEGSLHYVDRVPEDGFETTISPISVVVNDFSTREEPTTNTGIEVNLEQDAVLTWDGNMSVSPLRASGRLGLDNFPVQLPWRYMQGELPFTVEAGRFAFDLDYNLDYTTEVLDLDISNISAALTALDVRENGVEEAFLAGGTLSIENGSIAIPENRVRLESLSLDDFTLSAERDENGQLNWLTMLEALPGTASSGTQGEESTPEEASGTPWEIGIGTVSLNGTAFNFTDRVPEQDASVSLTLDATVEGLDNQPETEIPYNASIVMAAGGELSLDGEMQILPALTTDAALTVTALSLQPAQAWLNDYARIDIENGTLAMDASLSRTPQEPLSYQGNMRLEALQLSDREAGETLASLDTLSVNNVELSLADNRLDVSEVVVDAPYARVVINEDGSSNIGHVLQSGDQEEEASDDGAAADGDNDGTTDTEAGTEAAPMSISLGEIRLNDVSSDFTDRTLPIVFDTAMHTLNGTISGFSSDSAEPMRVALEGQVDEFGLVQIDGVINPLAFERMTDIDMSFSNLDMPAMSPYVIKFAGRRIEEGRADVNLSYEITDSALMASNAVVLRDLILGEQVEHPDAMDLPLDLAVALLKNGQGVIDLEVPVTGDVDDPQFSMGPIIRSAIANAITSVVSSPFSLLGSLVGGSEDSIESIRFQPGRSDIAPPEQQKLEQLIEALAQRPQLVLEVPGVMAGEADRMVLRTRAVEAALEERLEQDDNPDAQLNVRRQEALEALYTEAGLTPDLEMLRMEHTTSASDDGDDNEDAEAGFDALAYTEDLRQRLIMAQSVSESELERLATDRAEAVIAYIGINSSLDDSQYRTTETVTSDLDEDGWLTLPFDVSVGD